MLVEKLRTGPRGYVYNSHQRNAITEEVEHADWLCAEPTEEELLDCFEQLFPTGRQIQTHAA